LATWSKWPARNPVYVPTSQSNGWHWDIDQLEAAVDARTRAIVVCNPCNPTGYLPTIEQVERLALLAARHDLLVVTDESYERFLYDGRQLASLASQTDIADRLVVVRSMSKSFGMPGWRIGFVFAPAPILERCVAVFEWTSLRCSVVAQRAAWAALVGPQEWLSDLVGKYQTNRDLSFAAINATKRLSCRLPESCPFLFVDVSQLEDADSQSREDRLLRLGIPIVPGRHFMAPDFVRLPFGGESTTIELLARRLSAV
jgi:aminotransferase